jgi:hypothetical protein
VLIFFLVASGANAQVLVPGGALPTHHPSGDQYQLTKDDRGTEKVPLIVKMIPPDKSADDIAREREKSKLDRKTVELTQSLVSYTFRLFIATAFLTVATGALAGVAYLQMREGRPSIDAAKRAADTAERALTVVERAFVAVRDIGVFTITYGEGRMVAAFIVNFSVSNSGRTPARSFSSCINVAMFDKIPETFRFPDREHSAGNGIMGPQTQTIIQSRLAVQDAVDIYEKKKEGLIYGWLEYDDIFDDSPRHRTEFCVRIETFSDPRIIMNQSGSRPMPALAFPTWGKYNATDTDCHYAPGKTPIAEPGELAPITQPPQNPF